MLAVGARDERVLAETVELVDRSTPPRVLSLNGERAGCASDVDPEDLLVRGLRDGVLRAVDLHTLWSLWLWRLPDPS
ncbi:MAG: hypothetical protein AAF682_12495 [Planctomycetota bacterium]